MSSDGGSPADPPIVTHVAFLLRGSEGPAWDEEDISAALRGGAAIRHARCACGGNLRDAFADALEACGLLEGQRVRGAVALLQVAMSASIHRSHREFIGAMIDRFGTQANCLAVVRRVVASDSAPILDLWLSVEEKS
ncbi:MAG: hypothetical protein KKC79_17965 [Gammaproteobacteria bacterium]|nr:hypothetical protein [Gammaproteobacteria bacterium]MBU1441483.1 hypothetical protein [Gammaproteobacteria bacterium]MBU2410523.1 hypothetical protein [Gammaproteobacteria bacterium]